MVQIVLDDPKEWGLGKASLVQVVDEAPEGWNLEKHVLQVICEAPKASR